MPKFIEVTDMEGRKRLINTAWILDVWDESDNPTIYFAFYTPDMNEAEYVRVRGSYEEVKRKILEG